MLPGLGGLAKDLSPRAAGNRQHSRAQAGRPATHSAHADSVVATPAMPRTLHILVIVGVELASSHAMLVTSADRMAHAILISVSGCSAIRHRANAKNPLGDSLSSIFGGISFPPKQEKSVLYFYG